MSNQTEWRWADPAGQQRLVREDELREALARGAIPSNAPVWTRGWKEWRSAHEVPELTELPTDGSAAPGDVPPPPMFVVAAQNAFEGKPAPVPTGPVEPPPPPRYVPLDPQTQPHIPPAPASDTKVDAKRPEPQPSAKPPTKPPPLPTSRPPSKAPPPLPSAAKMQSKTLTSAGTAPGGTSQTPRVEARPPAALTKTTPLVTKSAPVAVAKGPPPPRSVTPSKQQRAFTHTQRPPMGVAPQSEELPSSGSRHTLLVGVAPPPLPKLDPLPMVSGPNSLAKEPSLAREPVAKEPLAKEASSKHPTLMMFEPQAPSQGPIEASQPIMVPANEPSAVTNAVTRPPPWGEGAVEMEAIPKSPGVPNVGIDRSSDGPPPRAAELSSSDLSSEARIAVVKAPPLAAAERPHGTMLGMGAVRLSENRAALEGGANRKAALPAAPLSQSDVASTNKWAPPATRGGERVERPSGAEIHDLRSIVQGEASVGVIQRAYATLRERTKRQPPWVLPAMGAGAALLVLIVLVAGVKAAIGTGASGSPAPSSGGTTTSQATTSTSSPKVTPVHPMACQTSGPARTVAPKALVSSGVEVVPLASQIALGFAVAPKEAALEILDATSLSSASALHLHATDSVRRVLALDASRAAVDGDHKGDKLQGRRTIASNPPIDLGSMDGGLVWAPHGSDKGIKLWSLVNPDAPIEALRGQPLPNGSTVVTYRSSGAIWFGAFAGTPPAPLAALTHVDGLGPQVGSPVIAASGDRVMVAWADRASPNDFWSIRYVTFKLGDETPPQAKVFALPAGGLGEQAMSPALASLGSGRFLFVWTEGAVSQHQVRGAVVEGGVATGAFTASTEGVNAGQGQAGVLTDGRGVVAFLAASQTGKGFEVAATPIQCVENK